MNKELGFARGARDGVPIGLGYLSVSFSFGLLAVRAGLPVWTAVLISATNLTSAGQLAGAFHYRRRRRGGGDDRNAVRHQHALCADGHFALAKGG